MIRFFRKAALGSVLLTWLGAGTAHTQQSADLILLDGIVQTMNETGEVAEAIAVANGRIVFVGSRSGVEGFRGPNTKVIGLRGQTVIPGLVDAHAHLMNLGNSLSRLNLVETSSTNEILDIVIAKQKQTAPGKWIRGRGWDQNDWDGQEFPSVADLVGTDANPVYLRRVDGHAAWVNRKALEVCGITKDTPDPDGGRIVRDIEGKPTGVFVDKASALISDKIPEADRSEKMRRIKQAIAECHRYGLTGMHDAGTTRDELGIFKELLSSGELTLRVYVLLDSDDRGFVNEQLQRGPWSDDTGHLTVRAIKLYADGALGSRGALLSAPYSDKPSQTGLLQTTESELAEWVRSGLEAGFQLGTHAIGDGANRLVLDIYERAMKSYDATDHRLRVEHAQIVGLRDLERFAKLGIIASMQPTHCTSDMYWAEDRVGSERIQGAYAWRTLLQRGVIMASGSDFPVESVNPLWGIYASVTRQDHKGWPEEGWYPSQRMTIEEAVGGFTIGAAYAEFAEDEKGTIEVGKTADFTVVEGDLFSMPAKSIFKARVTHTIVGGRIVFSSAQGGS